MKFRLLKKLWLKTRMNGGGNRSVKVRYEPVLRFDAIKTTISSINFKEPDTSNYQICLFQ